MQDDISDFEGDELDTEPDDDLELPDDIDPSEMAESIEDELVAEEGEDIGLDPDLAVFAARDDLPLDEGEETTFQ
jgi:hypothetical protein